MSCDVARLVWVSLVYVWIALKTRVLCVYVFFCVGPVHCSRDPQVRILTIFSLKLGLTILFTYLKIILLQCFQFLVFSNKRYPNRPLVPLNHIVGQLWEGISCVCPITYSSFQITVNLYCYILKPHIYIYIYIKNQNLEKIQLDFNWIINFIYTMCPI